MARDFDPKVGDRVRFRQWDDMEKEFGFNAFGSIKCEAVFTEEMRKFCGEEFTVNWVGLGRVRGFDFPDKVYHISKDMIEYADDDIDINDAGFKDLIENFAII